MSGKIKKKLKAERGDEDLISKSIGHFGIWQGTVCLMISALRFTSAWNSSAIMFLTPKTSFFCSKLSDNITVEVERSKCCDGCLEYTYENSFHDQTLISEFNLICHRAWMASFTQTALMFGKFIGVILFGWISDRYGRRIGLLLAISSISVFMLASSFAPNYWTFTFLRFLVGLSSGGILVISIVMVVEISGPKYKSIAGCLMFMSDGLAQASVVLFAYYTNSWDRMMLGVAVASSVFLIYFCLLPESPRWLIMSGKTDVAVDVLTKAACWNRCSTEDIPENVKLMYVAVNNSRHESGTSYNYLDLLKISKLRTRCLVAFLVWMVIGICYFGVNLYNSFIGANIYMSVMISGLIQIPVSPAAILLNNKRRKMSNIGTFIVSGVSMIILTFMPKDSWVSSALAIIYIFSLNTTFITFYLHSTELFPTSIRNMGLGLTSSGSKIGAMISPFAASLDPRWVPSIIFATLPFLAIILCFFLPETKGKKLENNLDLMNKCNF